MAIISQETFDKFTEEEKKKINEVYFSTKLNNYFNQGIRSAFKLIFGKENLQPEPEIRTWEDMKEEYMLHADAGTSYIIEMDKKFYSEKLALKALATLQIAKLIELGYGGMVTEEEWNDCNIPKYVLLPRNWLGKGFEVSEVWNKSEMNFIAFHTQQQAEEFMSYNENIKLVKQYYMI